MAGGIEIVRHRLTALAVAGVFVLYACAASPAPSRSTPAAIVATPAPSASPEPTATQAPSVTASPTPRPTRVEQLTESVDLTRFSNPTTVDNPWFPLKVGQRWTFAGAATIDGERLSRKVVLTVTDLTKVIAGVETVVAYEVDYTDDVLGEAEIVLWAQDDDGQVWRIGEYPEVYEDGQLVETPVWIHGYQEALAGIAMEPDPQPNTPSYAQGWGPAVEWNDRGRVFEVGSKTCVKVGCYDDVLVIDEFSRDEPDAHQLKYYASGVGNVRVGWAGAREEEQEVLELVRFETLSSAALGRVRAQALAQDARGYTTSPDVYAKTARAEAPSS